MGEECEGSLIRVFQVIPCEAVSLVGVNVAFTSKLFKVAQLYKLLRVDNWNVRVIFPIEVLTTAAYLHLIEELVRQAAVPLGDGVDGNALRACRQRDRCTH